MYATGLSVGCVHVRGVGSSQIMGGAKTSPKVRRQFAQIYVVIHVTTINKEVAMYQPQLNQRDERVYVSIIAVCFAFGASERYHEHVRNVSCSGLAQDVATLLKVNFGFSGFELRHFVCWFDVIEVRQEFEFLACLLTHLICQQF